MEITNCPKCNSTRLETKLKYCRDCWWHYSDERTGGLGGSKKERKQKQKATHCKICGSTEMYRPSAYCHKCYLVRVSERMTIKKANGYKRKITA